MFNNYNVQHLDLKCGGSQEQSLVLTVCLHHVHFFCRFFSHLSHRTDRTHTLLSSPTHLSTQAQLLLYFIKSILPFVMYKHSLATLLGTVVQLLVNTNIISCHMNAS